MNYSFESISNYRRFTTIHHRQPYNPQISRNQITINLSQRPEKDYIKVVNYE